MASQDEPAFQECKAQLPKPKKASENAQHAKKKKTQHEIFILSIDDFLSSIIANRRKKDTGKEKTALLLREKQAVTSLTHPVGSITRVQGPFGPAADVHLASLGTPAVDSHGLQVVYATRGAVIGVDPDVVAAPQHLRTELIPSPAGTTRMGNIYLLDRRPGLVDDLDIPRFLRLDGDRRRYGTNHTNKKLQDSFHSYSFQIAR
jgi:hypothetical protein